MTLACATLAFGFVACSSSSSNDSGGTAGGSSNGQSGSSSVAGVNSGGTSSNTTAGTGATTAGATHLPSAGTSGGGAAASGDAGNGHGGATAGAGGATGGTGGAAAGAGAASGGTGGAGGGGGAVSSCVGKAWPTADPTVAGPFQVTADKNVGPAAGVVPDPVYGMTQQHFNVYRPKDLADGYCHPILVWANGHTDNPEPNPPSCLSSNYCGSYLMLMNQLASHGFVVIASLSTITSQGDPLPTIVGLDWLLKQAEDSTSPYYHHLDTAHIGALGHSEGGLSTSKAASDPRFTAIATVSGSAANPGIHTPSLWFCGGKDTVVPCDKVQATYASITTQPAMLVDNLSADHGGWLYQNGAKGPDIFGFTAWFRVHLMNDTANRKMFYGADCTLCKDNRVTVMQNSLMNQ